MVEPHSIDEDIHDLLTQAFGYTNYMIEINQIVREDPYSKHGRNYGNTKSAEERAKVMHKNRYSNIILKCSTAGT